MITGRLRGHPIYFDSPSSRWRYVDTGEPTADTWRGRGCGECGMDTPDSGHDPCIEGLPVVQNACCGHGNRREAYVHFRLGLWCRGRLALLAMAVLRAMRRRSPVLGGMK